MNYKVNAQCTACGTRFSYMSDAPAETKQCPYAPHPSVEEKPRKRCPDTWDQGNDYS